MLGTVTRCGVNGFDDIPRLKTIKWREMANHAELQSSKAATNFRFECSESEKTAIQSRPFD